MAVLKIVEVEEGRIRAKKLPLSGAVWCGYNNPGWILNPGGSGWALFY